MNVKAYHDPFDPKCRRPFGAVPCGGRIELRVYIEGAYDGVAMRVWQGRELLLLPDEVFREGGVSVCRFTLEAPDEPCVAWYSFRVEAGGSTYYLGAENGELRCGSRFGAELPTDFRITVYRKDFETPEWFCGCTAYQIFPDRFRRGEYDGLDGAVEYHRSMGRTVVPKRWEEQVDYLPREGKRYYEPDDFYFGNFKGIAEAAPYLESLGVDAVYLNPIFESRHNHRYSTADYLKPDPLLGTEEDFASMCAELGRRGIRVILDGVFSHTGSDSRYFDREGFYGGGAYNDMDSPYRGWYFFSDRYKCGYRSWWGFDTLPEVDELEPSFMGFIAEVLKKWLRLGASGWRLDVADELPNAFLRFVRRTVKEADPEAVVIGEVWEDAVMKTGDTDGRGAYGLRGYVLGDMLDGVMDYPFMYAVCDFLNGVKDAKALKDALAAQLAGYPSPFMRAQLGMLGSHDTCRILSQLSGAPPKDSLSRPRQAVWRPAPAAAALGKKRLMQASALQFSMPFAPCIYYGDEAGASGLSDPFCRKPFPWGHEDEELLKHYRLLGALRRSHPVLRTGDTAFAAAGDDGFAVLRADKTGAAALTAVAKAQREFVLGPGDFIGEAELDASAFANAEALLLRDGEAEPVRLEAADGKLRFTVPENGVVIIKN